MFLSLQVLKIADSRFHKKHYFLLCLKIVLLAVFQVTYILLSTNNAIVTLYDVVAFHLCKIWMLQNALKLAFLMTLKLYPLLNMRRLMDVITQVKIYSKQWTSWIFLKILYCSKITVKAKLKLAGTRLAVPQMIRFDLHHKMVFITNNAPLSLSS